MSLLVREGLRGKRRADADRNPHKTKSIPVKPVLAARRGPFRRGQNPEANFTFQQPAQGQLVLDGAIDGHKIHMQLQLGDREKFLLVSGGFHWIQEYPFNR